MPLAFNSISHGTVAFGFFNIDSHMLLLEHYFFFADDFCRHMENLAGNHTESVIEQTWSVYCIEDPEAIGDLMGAIHGVHFTGFIGDVYRRFPFPPRPEDFKQNPEGAGTRKIISAIIQKYGESKKISVIIDALGETVALGDYHFDRHVFQALVRYVWQGGYPRWRDQDPPDYVKAMKLKLDQEQDRLFQGMVWDAIIKKLDRESWR